MKVEFSEIALLGIVRDVEDWERQQSSYHALKWYIARDVPHRAIRHPAFPDKKIYLYALGSTFRVLVEVRSDVLFVWSVRGRTGMVTPSRS